MGKAKILVENNIYYNQSYLVEKLLSDILCDSYEPGMEEVLEWWLVDGWLAERLRQEGEVVLSDYNCDWWGRKTSGQAIYMDWIIEQISE